MVDSGKHTFKVGDRVRFFRKSRQGKYKFGTVERYSDHAKWIHVRWDGDAKRPAILGSTLIVNLEPASINPRGGNCPKCGKPIFGPCSTIASGAVTYLHDYYCHCAQIFNPGAVGDGR